MISFRLSEDEYESLISVCENEGARSVSDLARDAVHRLIGRSPQIEVEIALRALEGRVDTLDLQIRRLSMTVDQSPLRQVRQINGRT